MSRTLHNSISNAAALGAPLTIVALLLSGCASSPGSAPSLQSSVAGGPGNSKPSSSKPSDWLAQAWQGWQRAQANPSRPPSPSPRLAFRAPAPLEPPLLERLQLAPQRLESRSLSLDQTRLGAFGRAPRLAPASYASELFASGEMWERALAEARLASPRPPGPAQVGAAGNWSALQELMERRQVVALQDLALRVSRQRREASADEEGLLRADLADDLERVGRLDLNGLAPALGPRERLERLSELRLKLLSTLAIAPEAVRQAEAEREKIEIEIRALLREQEKERAALLGKLRLEVPARLQAQRESQIKSALEQVRQADADLIQLLLADQGRRVRLDFAAPARFALPAPLTQNALGTASALPQISFNKNQSRTPAALAPSLVPIAPPALALRSAQVLMPAPATPITSDDLGDAEARGSGSGEVQRRWRELLSKRTRAWRAPVR